MQPKFIACPWPCPKGTSVSGGSAPVVCARCLRKLTPPNKHSLHVSVCCVQCAAQCAVYEVRSDAGLLQRVSRRLQRASASRHSPLLSTLRLLSPVLGCASPWICFQQPCPLSADTACLGSARCGARNLIVRILPALIGCLACCEHPIQTPSRPSTHPAAALPFLYPSPLAVAALLALSHCPFSPR
jgi:hypothetical protein